MYSAQGFNLVVSTLSYIAIDDAKRADSDFNPDGMMAGLDITCYARICIGVTNTYAISTLESRIQEIKDRDLMDHLLFFYWDNENAFCTWDVPQDVFRIVQDLDVDEEGNRLHPVYQLQGNEGAARQYHNDSAIPFTVPAPTATPWVVPERTTGVIMSDIVGTYVGGEFAGVDGSANDLITMDNIQGQRMPVVMAQLNGTEVLFRPRLYSAIMHGARGMGYFKDYSVDSTEGIPIYDRIWWDDLPDIRSEIDQLIPLIRRPHWTTWSAVSSSDQINLGTRNLFGEGYVLVANMSENSITTTITLRDLDYTPISVNDYFTDEVVTYVNENAYSVTIPTLYTPSSSSSRVKTFSVTIEAYKTAVYRLASEENCHILGFHNHP
jgi:hypothetical protein